MDNNPTPLFAKASPERSSSLSTLKFYCYPLDARFEDLGEVATPRFYRAILRDVHAGFIGAMVAIPLAISYSMAAGLKVSSGGCWPRRARFRFRVSEIALNFANKVQKFWKNHRIAF